MYASFKMAPDGLGRSKGTKKFPKLVLKKSKTKVTVYI